MMLAAITPIMKSHSAHVMSSLSLMSVVHQLRVGILGAAVLQEQLQLQLTTMLALRLVQESDFL